MQQAIPYKPSSWPQKSQPLYNKSKEDSKIIIKGSSSSSSSSTTTNVNDLVSENAVIVFARKGCCMGHVVKRLLLCLGVNPPIHEVEEEEEDRVSSELSIEIEQLPVVFIGGKLFGGLERVMATHITGELVPVLKQAGALWL